MSLLEEGKLQEARRAGEELVALDPCDRDAMSALIDVYLAIEQRCVDEGVTCYMTRLSERVEELLEANAPCESQRDIHRRHIMACHSGYKQLHALEELSARDGHEAEAYRQARAIYDAGQIDPRLHPILANILYRYGRVLATGEDSIPVRRLLNFYLTLSVEHPSPLHSLILGLAIKVARRHSDFDFVRFLEIWDTSNLRADDFSRTEGHRSLASMAVELVLESDRPDEATSLMGRPGPGKAQEAMTAIREAFDAMVARRIKNGDNAAAIDLLMLYASHQGLHGRDIFHSRLLSHALKTMHDNQSQFIDFFILWSPALLSESDLSPALRSDGSERPPLAQRALNACYSAIKENPDKYTRQLNTLLDTYGRLLERAEQGAAASLAPRFAMLMTMADRHDDALKLMARLARNARNHTAAFWLDYISIAPGEKTLPLLALGILTIKGNDPRRADLMLTLTHRLKQADYDNAAAGLLQRYRDDCESGNIAAEPQARYNAVRATIPVDTMPDYGNEALYNRLAADALDFIYYDVKTEFMSIAKRAGNILTAVSSTSHPLMIDTVLLPIAGRLDVGDCIAAKRIDGQAVMIRPDEKATAWSSLEKTYGIVAEPGYVCNATTGRGIKCKRTPAEGTFVRLSLYRDIHDTLHGVGLEPVDIREARRAFHTYTAAIYMVDEKRIGIVTDDCSHIVDRTMYENASVGSVVKIVGYEDRKHDLIIVGILAAPPNVDTTSIVESVSGPLSADESGTASVRHVQVDSDLLARTGIDLKTYVTCRALRHPDGTWHALSLSPYT